MKLIVGAPVADRDWALPRWFECLQQQTRPPDEYVFVVKELPGSATRQMLHELCPVPVPQLSYAMDRSAFVPRYERNMHDVRRVYGDFAERRNLLLNMVRKREPDVFLSLDTDIMLDDSTVIERLLAMLDTHMLAAPCTFLHPTGRASECFNAAWWAAGDEYDPKRAWRRATAQDAAEGVQEVDIPMAAVAMTSGVLHNCRYRHHEQGEDLGFAQDLWRYDLRCAWDPDLEVRHVMSEDAL